MRKIAKIVLPLSIILSLILSFTACSGNKTDIALTIGGAEVGNDVYAYYLDKVMQDAKEDITQENAIKAASDKCAEYVKINSEFNKLKLVLSSSAKAEIAASVNDIWGMFGGYYESIGVSKQTLTNVKENEAYRAELVNAIYGAGGEKEISADSQQEYYKNNFVFFKAISSYLCTTDKDGKTVALPAEELTAISEKFASLKGQVTADNTIDAVNKAYVESSGGSAEAEMPVLSATSVSDSYPEGFFKDVNAMQAGDVKVLQYESYIFLVQKVDGANYYSDYAKSNLITMTADEFAKELNARYAKTKVESNGSVETACYKLIESVKANKT